MKRLAAGLATVSLMLVAALPVAAADEAMVRVIHASPDAPNVDVWLDGDTVLTDVPFTAVSDYLAVPAGEHNIQVTATGSTDPVIDADLTFEANTSYSVAAIGPVADIGATVLTDDRAPADGMSKLRVFHASPAAPASVDVAVTDGPVLVEGLAYPEATDYLTVDPGTYPLEIRAAGETDAALTLEATLAAGQNVTAIAMDGGDAGVQVIIADDTADVPDTALPLSTPTLSLVTMAGVAVLLAGVLLGRRAPATRETI
ncbi:MAG: DUF4397 domain-containing protein [Chloroflexi bacterium]|nr:DUF4397 domain-containing protein [Chloroflexota bacterium]